MLRLNARRSVGAFLRQRTDAIRCASTANTSHQPNAPLELDPAFQTLLRDVEMSLRKKAGTGSDMHGPRELELFPHDSDATQDYLTSAGLDTQETEGQGRKSPAAAFGSQGIGALVVPLELQTSIERMIADSDKSQLRQSAKRLFEQDSGSEDGWSSVMGFRYRTGKVAGRHALPDATAFATVALPAHYSAIYAVLDHLKQRLGPDWQVRRVIDWGAATGSGLWASTHAFQRTSEPVEGTPLEAEHSQMSQTALDSYLGLDKREGLVRIGKRLLKDLGKGELDISWQKLFHEDNAIDRVDGPGTMALSAFLLSTLQTDVDRKQLVKQMWDSGAEVMVIIDHTFDHVAGARDYLLKLGQKEVQEASDSDYPYPIGTHVVAPCPHDGACPLYDPGRSKLACSFSQRMQRPAFVRKTKHSGTGHEDMRYSYVVIRRGPRPAPATTRHGRIGDVGRRALAKEEETVPITQLSLAEAHHEHSEDASSQVDSATVQDLSPQELPLGPSELAAALRHEAYSWPRLVFPPLKRSGHIIIDGCTVEGQIMRMTIPKSQGKQPFYDARKSSWGDIFPHEPKNPPQVRRGSIGSDEQGQSRSIGKRKELRKKTKTNSYGEIAKQLESEKKTLQRSIRRAKRRQDGDYDD
ncbi:mitochondrial small ribosomal subunit Rsm22-domain-containing protein [Epithele typhae]|uniref:mitochondrial small ribosomal subunit Rsm22-domain-containing protein n=1 Tax=Epithele typhae TaxID=378194 RepID=UPI002008D87A|nr:mitochondrial small ribosomal subunit Rsm22-domain-containing protein [Epithele typhae]KAH9943984.1 mitochondrial small ribosomal subunit Rsm22-domain-containing protein [Epithele typhae]